MLRRAEWRTLSRDPKTPLAWWCRETAAKQRLGVVLATAIASFLVLWAGAPGLVPLLLVAGIVWFSVAGEIRKGKVFVHIVALAASPSPTELFFVEFSLYADGVCTGTDQGIASVVEGWLYVEGLHTSFSLRPSDLRNIAATYGKTSSFELPEGQTVEIRSLSDSRTDRETFHETIRVWRNFPFALPKGEPLLPPLSLHGSASIKPKVALVCGRILAAILLVCGVVGFLNFGYFILPVIAVAIVSIRPYLEKMTTDVRTLSVLETKSLPW